MSLETIIGIAGIALALAGALGVAYAVFKSATVTKTIELLKVENEVLGKSVARQEQEMVKKEERLRALETANEVLRQTVSGEKAVALLSEQARVWFDTAKEQHRMQMLLLQDMHDVIVPHPGRRHE